MDESDLILLTIAAYVAVISLIRLMQRHRNEVVASFETEIERERMHQQEAERKEKKRAARAKRKAAQAETK